jgi:hypothetical protein
VPPRGSQPRSGWVRDSTLGGPPRGLQQLESSFPIRTAAAAATTSSATPSTTFATAAATATTAAAVAATAETQRQTANKVLRILQSS